MTLNTFLSFHIGMGSLESCYSECDPQTRSRSIRWELVSNANLWLYPRPAEQRSHILTKSQGGFICICKLEEHWFEGVGVRAGEDQVLGEVPETTISDPQSGPGQTLSSLSWLSPDIPPQLHQGYFFLSSPGNRILYLSSS